MVFKAEQQKISQVESPKKTRKKQPPKGGRWTVVALFLFTLLTIAIFYLKAELPLFWQKMTAPLVITNISQEKKFDPAPILNEIRSLTKDLRGTYGVYVYRFDDQNEYGLHQNEIFPAASLIKLPVILALFQEAEAGRVNLEAKYKLVEKDKIGGAGILQGKPAGTTYTYHQLAELMGQYSDNTAFGVLRRILGDEKIEQIIKQLGMNKTSLKENKTSPEDIGIFFKKLYQREILTPEHGGEILAFLTKTAFEDWIPAGVPQDIRVAHKIGKDLGTFSDGGIVFAQRPFVLVIISKNAKESEAKEILPKITETVWNFETSSQ